MNIFLSAIITTNNSYHIPRSLKERGHHTPYVGDKAKGLELRLDQRIHCFTISIAVIFSAAGLVQRCVIVQKDNLGFGFTVCGERIKLVQNVRPGINT